MKKEELRKMIAGHRALMNWAKAVLDRRYYELESRGEEGKWLTDYNKHKKIVEWLESLTPDDSPDE